MIPRSWIEFSSLFPRPTLCLLWSACLSKAKNPYQLIMYLAKYCPFIPSWREKCIIPEEVYAEWIYEIVLAHEQGHALMHCIGSKQYSDEGYANFLAFLALSTWQTRFIFSYLSLFDSSDYQKWVCMANKYKVGYRRFKGGASYRLPAEIVKEFVKNLV